jgi:hypothetical protein
LSRVLISSGFYTFFEMVKSYFYKGLEMVLKRSDDLILLFQKD